MKQRTVATELASALAALCNCVKDGWRAPNLARIEIWGKHINNLMETAPSGSGFDNGTKLLNLPGDEFSIHSGALRFRADYHHMNEAGYYDGWGEYVVVVRPSWIGIAIDVKGRNRNDIKAYILDVFSDWLNSPAEPVTADSFQALDPSASQ